MISVGGSQQRPSDPNFVYNSYDWYHPNGRLPAYAVKRAQCGEWLLTFDRFVGQARVSVDGFPHWSRSFVFSDETPNGYYRWLVAASGAMLSRTGQVPNGPTPINLHIVPPIGRDSIATGQVFSGTFLPDFFQSLATKAGPGGNVAGPPTVASVKINPGSWPAQDFVSDNNAQIDSGVGLPLAVPGGWRILSWEDGDYAPNLTAFVFMELRLAYYQIPNGYAPPSRGNNLRSD